MSRNTFPLSTRHLYPRIGPPFMNIHRLPRRIRALGHKATRCDGSVAKNRYLSRLFKLAHFEESRVCDRRNC